ncbi:MAG: hypothetical protein COT15_00455 [Candidatus Diapherotrites archaeon CG08_land_8_20_14_0_20_34_12]|nr:MAG: hypothetical protein COT15_00455 [Candidatus Diapherotrites archaeon CG08_land_8_20_14_0_20_34_12]
MIVLENTKQLQTAIKSISNFISEGNFRFNDKGIALRAIDPSQIVLVNYFAPKGIFKKFSVEPSLIGINIEDFDKIMRRVFSNDVLELSLEDSCLNIRFVGELDRTFKLSLIELNEEEASLPEVAFNAKITIKARILQETLKDASLFGSSIVLKIKDNVLTMEARGQQGTLKTLIKKECAAVDSKEEINNKYSLSFFENLIKEADPESDIKLELKNEAPMKISYKIADSEIQFYLAHMIL